MYNNLNATLKKIVVIFLIITLTYANIVLIGSNIVKGLISYAAEEGEEQPELVVNQGLVMNKVCEINGEEKRIIQVAIETGIESDKYPIKESTLTLSTNLIEETLEDVSVTELNKNTYTTGTWILEEGKLKITLANENETLESKDKGLDKLLVTYVFPTSEIETIKQPLENVEVKTYTNKTITSEWVESSFEDINIEKDLLLLNIVNKDIHKTTITEAKVEYTEKLDLDVSYRKKTSNIIVEDIENTFYNNNGQENSEVFLKYKTTTINKKDLLTLLGEEGILVITDTLANKELVEVKKEMIEAQEMNVKVEQKFTDEETGEEEVRSNVTVTDEAVKIEYAVDVTNFKLELTNIKAQSENVIEFSKFVVENIKVISNINDIDSLSYLQENIKYVTDGVEKTTGSTVAFKDTTTRASLKVDSAEWVVGQANTVKYTITLDTSSEKTELYVDPMFLIELPSSVESINTANSEFTVNNDNGAFTNKKVFVTTILGRKIVVITLEGTQTEETILNGNTTINLTLELNVSEAATEGNETTKLYYQNNTVTAYESGKSFDTAEVTVSMIMESEPKDEIPEIVVPDEGDDILLLLTSSTKPIINPEEEFAYNVNIINNDSTEKQNLQLTSSLPEGISIVKVLEVEADEEKEMSYTFDDSTRKFTINIDKLDGSIYEQIKNEETGEVTEFPVSFRGKTLKIIVKADNLPEGIYSKEIKHVMTLLKGDNTLAKSEEVVNIISDAFLSIEIENLPEQINELEEFILGLKITNKGLEDIANANINIDVPEEISLRKYKMTVFAEDGQEESTDEGTLSKKFEMKNLNIAARKTYYFQITGKVKEINGSKQVTINGTVNGKELNWTIGIVDLTVDPDNPGDPENPTNPDEPTDPENPTNPDEPTDPENPTNPDEPIDPENPTNPDKPIDPDNPDNPDNPEDPENPTNSETPENKNFDLSLNQYLSKVTIVNSKGTTTYNYKDTNFAKVEIHSKHMNGSKVTLEYRIIVKNEGTIPGYARKIVYYISSDLKFNEELNEGWYLGDDGNIYSIALIDKLLNPGETAEMRITLEKQMTNENVGTITTLAEIYEASNDEDVEDINSIPGDKLDGQNDMSKVEVIIATSTGTIVLYTTLAIVIITILGYGFYRVKKIMENKKGGC